MTIQDPVLQALPDLLRASNLEQLKGMCQRLVNAMEFDHFIIALQVASPELEPQILAITTYPDAWCERYQRLQWAQHDPVVAHCVSSPVPIAWYRERFQSERSDQLFEDAAAHGVRSGIATGLRSFGSGHKLCMSVTSGASADAKTKAWLMRTTPAVHMLSTYVYEAVGRVHGAKRGDDFGANLTARERECIQWAAAGKTSWETSRILGCSQATINFHMRNVLQKLCAVNRRQAVARALALGLIEV